MRDKGFPFVPHYFYTPKIKIYQLNRAVNSTRRFAEPPPPPKKPKPPPVERERPNEGEVSEPTGELKLTVLKRFVTLIPSVRLYGFCASPPPAKPPPPPPANPPAPPRFPPPPRFAPPPPPPPRRFPPPLRLFPVV